MEKPMIVQSNDLVEASYNLSIDEMRLLSFVASKIDSKKKNIGEIKVSSSEFSNVFSLSKANVHRNLINSVKTLANKSVTMQLDNKRNIVLPWLAMGIYDRQPNEGSYVIVAFSQYIEPYLFELKDKFTAINFEYASKLTTPFSYRLYQWLIKAKHLNSAKDCGSIKVVLDLEWMKKQAGLDGLYERWVNFRDRMIEPAIEQINSKTEISVIWKPIKQGKAVKSVQFNYLIETAIFAKPMRPRLHRRPKVLKHSHEEGVWMRKNLSLLLDYEIKLKCYDDKDKMALGDLRKMKDYASIFDSALERRLEKEISERSKSA